MPPCRYSSMSTSCTWVVCFAAALLLVAFPKACLGDSVLENGAVPSWHSGTAFVATPFLPKLTRRESNRSKSRVGVESRSKTAAGAGGESVLLNLFAMLHTTPSFHVVVLGPRWTCRIIGVAVLLVDLLCFVGPCPFIDRWNMTGFSCLGCLEYQNRQYGHRGAWHCTVVPRHRRYLTPLDNLRLYDTRFPHVQLLYRMNSSASDAEAVVSAPQLMFRTSSSLEHCFSEGLSASKPEIFG